jgi:hypothetical protein
LLRTVRDHFINNGRDPSFRIWRGPGERDSFNDEWEEDFWRPIQGRTVPVDTHIETQQMVDDAFVQDDVRHPSEERICEEVIRAFSVADRIHKGTRRVRIGTRNSTFARRGTKTSAFRKGICQEVRVGMQIVPLKRILIPVLLRRLFKLYTKAPGPLSLLQRPF